MKFIDSKVQAAFSKEGLMKAPFNPAILSEAKPTSKQKKLRKIPKEEFDNCKDEETKNESSKSRISTAKSTDTNFTLKRAG